MLTFLARFAMILQNQLGLFIWKRVDKPNGLTRFIAPTEHFEIPHIRGGRVKPTLTCSSFGEDSPRPLINTQ